MASIRSKNGGWEVTISLGLDPATKKYSRKSFMFRGGKRDADRYKREIETRYEKADYRVSMPLTLEDVGREWLDNWASNRVRQTTLQRYKHVADKYIFPKLGSMRLDRMTSAHIQSYYNWAMRSGRRKEKGGLSRRTVKNHHAVLSRILKHALRQGFITQNPLALVDPPRPEKRQMPHLDMSESVKLIQESKKTRYFPLLTLAYMTGLRAQKVDPATLEQK